MRAVTRAVVVLLISGFSLWVVSVALVIYAGARPALRKADAILVLGAAQYNGRPSPVLQARLDHALDLYNRGLASYMIFTGGVGVRDTVSEAEVSQRYAIRHGVPASAI
ncbi:MAG TPA: YdcF family protein, partial [Gemmatimonadaceae bacterium]|nr:YdcF family protein [Gemmatimonadaceae bacterium]